ncbi:MAG TPA: LamG-like jellyroll fold domain-containing protein, partial [Blastocatellia bacterium]
MHAIMGDGTAGFDVTSTGTVSSSLQHWAITFIRSTSQVFFYKNGVFDSAVTIPPPNLPGNVNQSVPTILGADFASPTRLLNATLDDVRIYNVARTATAVASDFAAEVPGNSANLVGYWTFNEGSGTVVHDSTANGDGGTLQGSGVSFTTATQRVLPTGTRISNTISTFAGIGPVTSSTIAWTANLPAGTSLQVATSFDNGQSFQTATNGGSIPSINLGDALGWAIAATDINGDGTGDLIVAAPFTTETVSGVTRFQAGTAYFLPGNNPIQTTPSPTPSASTTPSPQGPVVTITAPIGGETLLVGHQFNITWTASDPGGDSFITNFAIALSIDGGNTFNTIIASTVAGTDRSFTWTVPSGLDTTQGRIMITVTDANNLTATSTSPNNFTITDQGVSVTLLSPLGGEDFKFGQVVPISWSVDSSDQSMVEGFDLLLSTDGGVTFALKLVTGSNPDGPALGPTVTSYNWTVPGDCTSNAKIAVVTTSLDGITSDSISTSSFTIDDYGPSVNTNKMGFSKTTGEMTFATGTPASGPVVDFSDDVTIEVSSDEAGTQFFAFSKPPTVNKAGTKMSLSGKIDGMKAFKFFPVGASRVIIITNPVCASTVLQVTHSGNKLVLTSGAGSDEKWRARAHGHH